MTPVLVVLGKSTKNVVGQSMGEKFSKDKIFAFNLIILFLGFLAFNFSFPQILNLPKFPKKNFKLGLDLQGGVHLVYQADLSQIEEKERKFVMDGLKDILERRVNLFGVSEPLIQVQGERIIVELPGVVDPVKAVEEIGKTPYLEFREESEKFREISEKKEATESEILEAFKPTPLTGRYLKRADFFLDPMTSEPSVTLEFNEEGAKIFEDLTQRNIGKHLAIFIDQKMISSPVVREKISGGKAQITGRFTVEEAKELARNLNAGALPAPIKLISQKNVGPTLGKISLEKSLKAGVVGFFAILVFMIFYYRLLGLMASFALTLYTFFVLSLFKIFNFTLTLSGIGGFLLSLGMAVDANVLIFSRMREELNAGKSFKVALEEGIKRAWPAIRDGNLTTLLVCAILFFFGTSFVRGFAMALSLGILVSMFTAIVVTGNFLRIFVDTRLEKIKILW
jgi:protein-export membrane protein SecD